VNTAEGAPDAGRGRLFAYGTLMFGEVFRAVCGVERPGRPATLAEYVRLQVRGEAFPAIVARSGAHVPGLLIEGIEPALWARLDAFESDFYQRVTVRVLCGDDACLHAAQTYVAHPAVRNALSEREWSPENFRVRDLARYL